MSDNSEYPPKKGLITLLQNGLSSCTMTSLSLAGDRGCVPVHWRGWGRVGGPFGHHMRVGIELEGEGRRIQDQLSASAS